MMSNKHLSIFLLGFLGLLLPVSLPAQTAEWQPISPQELALHDNPNHPGDAAMVLLRDINTNAVAVVPRPLQVPHTTDKLVSLFS